MPRKKKVEVNENAHQIEQLSLFEIFGDVLSNDNYETS